MAPGFPSLTDVGIAFVEHVFETTLPYVYPILLKLEEIAAQPFLPPSPSSITASAETHRADKPVSLGTDTRRGTISMYALSR